MQKGENTLSPAEFPSSGSNVLAKICFGLCIVLSASCGKTDAQLSDVKHDADQPTRGTETFMWQSVSNADYASVMAPVLGIDPSKLLASDHALAKKTQFWLDKLDAGIRGAHPDQLANVPKPFAKVIKDSSANAFVGPVPVCYKMPVKVGSGTATASNTVDTIYLDLKTGELSQWPSDLSCVNGATPTATLKGMVAKFNASDSDCKYSISSDNKLVPNSSCTVNADSADVVAAKSVTILETANYVTVHTGLFPLMTEESFVAVIAHELGHYYRSHMTAQEDAFDFFYTLNQNQPDHRPVADSSKKELGDGAVASATLLTSSDTHTSYPSQQLRSELFFGVGSLIDAACAAGSCSTACSAAKTLITSSAFDDKIGSFPFGATSDDQKAAVGQFETKALACLATIKLSTSPGTQTGTTVSWDVVKKSVESPGWPTWLGTLPASTQKTLATVTGLDALRLGDSAPNGADLKTVLVNAAKALTAQDNQGVALLKQAQQQHLGQYTIEQEADEESAEWVTSIGLDPKSAVEAMHSLNKGATNDLHGFILGETDCDALWNKHWTNADGSYSFVPVGDFAEIHHSTCYRMFNLDREIKAHGYHPANVPLPTMGGAAWASLQETASGLGESTESIGFSGFHELAKVAKKANMATCSYASSYR